MKSIRAPRLFAIFLIFAIALPSSASALRVSQEGAGLEELGHMLAPAAGMEEGPVNVRKLRNRVGRTLIEFIRETEWSIQFENVQAPNRTPAKHLVKGADQEWWIHMHVAVPHKEGDKKHFVSIWSLKNGLLFRLITDKEGKIVGLADPLAEEYNFLKLFFVRIPPFFVALGRPAGESRSPLLSPEDLDELRKKALETVLKSREDLESAMRTNEPRYTLVKSVSKRSSSYFLELLGIHLLPPPSIWLMEPSRGKYRMIPKKPYFILELPEGVRFGSFGRVPKWSYRGIFQRLDLPVTPEAEVEKSELLQSMQDAGMEESVAEMVKRLGSSQEPITVEMVLEIRRRVLEEGGEAVDRRLNAYTTDGRQELSDLVQWLNRESNKPYQWDMFDFLISDRFGPGKLNADDPIVHAAFVSWVMGNLPLFKNGNHRTGWALMNVVLLRAKVVQQPLVWDENKAPEYYAALRSADVEEVELRLPAFIDFVKSSLLPASPPVSRQILENIGDPSRDASKELDDPANSSTGLEELA